MDTDATDTTPETISYPAQIPVVPSTPPPIGGYVMSDIFYEPVEAKILFDLFEQICQKTDRHYIFNILAYRRMKFLKLHIPFLNTIIPRYQTSKQYFITREQTFKNFLTIVKQICNHNRIPVTSSIHYFESDYIIYYFIPHHERDDKEEDTTRMMS